jgi:hypothetical protein
MTPSAGTEVEQENGQGRSQREAGETSRPLRAADEFVRSPGGPDSEHNRFSADIGSKCSSAPCRGTTMMFGNIRTRDKRRHCCEKHQDAQERNKRTSSNHGCSLPARPGNSTGDGRYCLGPTMP